MSINFYGTAALVMWGLALPSVVLAECSASPGGAQTPVVSSSATLKVDVLLRDQPRMVAAAVDGALSRAAGVTLQARVVNREGAWWFVRRSGRSGWVQAGALQFDPA